MKFLHPNLDYFLIESLIKGKKDYLGADLLFPLLVAVLVHAELPTVHLIMVKSKIINYF